MPNLTFYRQARIDGGIRTGIELDEDTVFEYFEEGGSEPDPHCSGTSNFDARVQVSRMIPERQERG